MGVILERGECKSEGRGREVGRGEIERGERISRCISISCMCRR